MNILLLTDDLFPGGVQRHVTDLANRLVQLGHRVSVGATHGAFSERLHNSVERIEVPLARTGRRGLWIFLKGLLLLQRTLRGRHYDVLHSHMRYADALGRVLALVAGIPHVSTCHSLFEGGRWFSFFGRETIAVSEAVREMLVGTYGKSPESVTVLYHELHPAKALSPKLRHEAVKKYDLQRARHILFCVGRLSPEKAPGVTLKAMRILKERGILNGTKLLMVGYGDLRDRMAAEIKSLELEGHAVLLPETTDVDVVLNIADFGVLSSLREGGIPYVILEAASLGKPVVATATGGILEFIREKETGLLAPAGDEVSFADAIQHLLENPAFLRRLGRNARQRYLQFHASNNSAEQTLAIYKKAIGQHRS